MVDQDPFENTLSKNIPLDELIIQLRQNNFGILITTHVWSPSIIKVSSPNWNISEKFELPDGVPFSGGIESMANKLYRDCMIRYFSEGGGIVSTGWKKSF